MAGAHQFCPLKQQVYATLSPEEREFAESLLHVHPNYRYDRSGLPKLDPIPAAGGDAAGGSVGHASGTLVTRRPAGLGVQAGGLDIA